jgi:hypothetical protein
VALAHRGGGGSWPGQDPGTVARGRGKQGGPVPWAGTSRLMWAGPI